MFKPDKTSRPDARAQRRPDARARGWVLALTAIAGCTGGAQGVPPPPDRVFFPTALNVSHDGRWLYVVNANSDLRYNTGTLVAVDLQRAASMRAAAVEWEWPICAPFRGPPDNPPAIPCCRDILDNRIVNCDDRSLVRSEATVRIGSFGSAITTERFDDGVERLFMGVRSDPSITFVDATSAADGPHFRCSGPRTGGTDTTGTNPECSDDWKIRSREQGPFLPTLQLPEEPFALALDAGLKILYVGHLGTGLSTIDLCDRDVPALANVNTEIFPGALSPGVTALTVPTPGNVAAPIYATSRLGNLIGELVLKQGTSPACPAVPAVRDLTVISSNTYQAQAFYPEGLDLRGFFIQKDLGRAFVLSRNTTRGPAALVRVDLGPGNFGRDSFQTTDVIEVCSGPSALIPHDAGRGLRLYVPCFESGQVYVIDPDAVRVVGIIDAGHGPASIAFSDVDPTLGFISGFSESTVSVVDLTPDALTENRIVQRVGFPKAAQN